MSQTEALEQKISLQELEGKWYIHQTNFPMWLKGNKKKPTLNYSITSKKDETVLFDKVLYTKNGKQKSIKGFDFALNEYNTSFIWKGKGILGLLSSKWKIIYYNKQYEWAIIYFEKTLFTPKGYDVISKHQKLNADVISLIKNKTKELKINNLLTKIEQ